MSGESWSIRPETAADLAGVRAVNLEAFPTAAEADLVDALRRDPEAWIDGLSYVAESDGEIIGHALATRSRIDDVPVLALAPCAVIPARQGTGVGTAVITALLAAARARGETAIIVLGHAEYYPRFGFEPASRFGIGAPFDVPDEAFMALAWHGEPLPVGTMRYPQAFGA